MVRCYDNSQQYKNSIIYVFYPELPAQLLQDTQQDGQALIQIVTDITSLLKDMIRVCVQMLQRNNLVGPDNNKIR